MIVHKVCQVGMGYHGGFEYICGKPGVAWWYSTSSNDIRCDCIDHALPVRYEFNTYEDALAYAAMESL